MTQLHATAASPAAATPAPAPAAAPAALLAGGQAAAPAARTLRFAAASCYLGRILVATSPQGIASIQFGDDDETLSAELARRAPGTRLLPDSEGLLAAELAQILSWLEEPGTFPPLTLDIQGTAFQRRVWQALRAVPAGETTSYSTLARDIGKAGAARAVARACAENRIAGLIPCHRVIAADGSLSGYRWGVKRKAALLAREKKAAKAAAA